MKNTKLIAEFSLNKIEKLTERYNRNIIGI